MYSFIILVSIYLSPYILLSKSLLKSLDRRRCLGIKKSIYIKSCLKLKIKTEPQLRYHDLNLKCNSEGDCNLRKEKRMIARVHEKYILANIRQQISERWNLVRFNSFIPVSWLYGLLMMAPQKCLL